MIDAKTLDEFHKKTTADIEEIEYRLASGVAQPGFAKILEKSLARERWTLAQIEELQTHHQRVEAERE